MNQQVIYLLEQIGDKWQMILTLISIGEIKIALEKVVEADYMKEPYLWDLVWSYCIDNQRYGLLIRQLVHFKPSWSNLPVRALTIFCIEIIWSIPNDSKFQYIKKSIIKAITHLKLQNDIYENSCRVTKNEFYIQSKKLSKGIVFGVGQLYRRQNWIMIEEDQDEKEQQDTSEKQDLIQDQTQGQKYLRRLKLNECYICEFRITKLQKAVIFRCGHMYHFNCISKHREQCQTTFKHQQRGATTEGEQSCIDLQYQRKSYKYSFERLCLHQRRIAIDELRCVLCSKLN